MILMPDAQQMAEDARAGARPIGAWLLEDERIKSSRTTILLDLYVRRLIDAGLPVDRATLHIQQLHPQLGARTVLWEREAGGAVETGLDHRVRHAPAFLASPVKRMYDGCPAIRRHLEAPDCPMDFPILSDLREKGVTDYTMRPIAFSSGGVNALSLATIRPGGFADQSIALVDATLPAFGAVLELRQLRRTARDLLSTYVGPNTGERIFNGAIRRGDGQMIYAVIWYCDLRGFTSFSEGQPLDEVIAVLNAYFDRMAAPVVARGGEILKFIGDAMLAIFPCEATCESKIGIADNAVAAAEAAIAGVADLNEARRKDGKPPVECGVALHIGEAMYGNIGAADRLDFTVIGPAVNLVSRLEPICVTLDYPLVASATLAGLSRREFRSLGPHTLKGIAKPQEVFTLA